MSIVEKRTYVLKAEFGPKDYFAAFEEYGKAVQTETLGGFLAYFASEVGELNAVISLWSYPSFEERLARRAALAVLPEWHHYLGIVRPMIQRMENSVLIPAPFSPIK